MNLETKFGSYLGISGFEKIFGNKEFSNVEDF